MKTVLCYGDSNTWGYDPRDPMDARYPLPWPALLGEGYQAVNLGENGRMLPDSPRALALLDQAIHRWQPDILTLLLGTNDLLQGRSPQAMGDTMEALLDHLSGRPLLVMGLPPVAIAGFQGLRDQVNSLYCSLARQRNLAYLDLSALALAWDGVHLTEESHRLLGRMVRLSLEELP